MNKPRPSGRCTNLLAHDQIATPKSGETGNAKTSGPTPIIAQNGEVPLSPKVETVHDIQLVDIVHTQDMQPREIIDDNYVKELADIGKNQFILPPLVVFRDTNGIYWLADGFHRIRAHLVAKLVQAPCIVKIGDKRDAMRYALSANAKHGKRPSAADRRRAVQIALADPEWAKMSDRSIAEMCGVSHPFVANVRHTLGNGFQEERTGKDGKKRTPKPKKEREPGDDTPEPSHNGKPIFDWRAAEASLGVCVRIFPAIANAYDERDCEEFQAAEQVLESLVTIFKAWCRRLDRDRT